MPYAPFMGTWTDSDGVVRQLDGTARSVALVTTLTQSGSATFGNTVVDPAAPTTVGDRVPVTARVALAASDAAGGVFSWANPTGGTVIIKSLVVNVTTFSAGACTIDCGVAATAGTLSDTLIDGASVATPARTVDSQKDAGTNGTGSQQCTTGQFVTGSMASGATAGLVGFAYIEYIKV